MSNNAIKPHNQPSHNANRRIWIVPESRIQTKDETSQEQWGYDDWEIYHGA